MKSYHRKFRSDRIVSQADQINKKQKFAASHPYIYIYNTKIASVSHSVGAICLFQMLSLRKLLGLVRNRGR